MNELKIPFTPTLFAESDLDKIDCELSNLQPQKLDHLLWSNDGYKPNVSFNIAHNGKCIFLKYTIDENHIRAVYNNTNDPVFKDSCVEFFIGIENDINYYNLEFNCLGANRIGYGKDRNNRMCLPDSITSDIRSQTKLKRANKGYVYQWSLLLTIPVSIFMYHKSIALSQKACKVNFYKCGDDLPQPHFMSWSNITSNEPNFHQPEYFGKGVFLNQ